MCVHVFTLLILIISVVQKKSGNEHSTLFTKKFSLQTNGCFYDVYNHVPYLHARTNWLRYFLSCSIIHVIPKCYVALEGFNIKALWFIFTSQDLLQITWNAANNIKFNGRRITIGEVPPTQPTREFTKDVYFQLISLYKIILLPLATETHMKK
jgi:hypothetical protein